MCQASIAGPVTCWMPCPGSHVSLQVTHRTPLTMLTRVCAHWWPYPFIHTRTSGFKHRRGKCVRRPPVRGLCSLSMNFVKGTTGRALAGFLKVNFWCVFQVLLPLVDQYFTNHRLYFLSSPLKPLSSSGYASHKEKEMVAR